MRFACFDRWNDPKPDLAGVTEAKWTSGVDGTRTLELTCVSETTVGKGDRIVFTDPRGNLQETVVVSPGTPPGGCADRHQPGVQG